MRGVRSSKVKAVKEDTLMVTVDVGMTSNMGYCTTADGRDIKPFKFGNTREGFDKLWSETGERDKQQFTPQDR